LREQLGPEATDRLHQLAESQQGFEQQLAGYLAELKPLPAERRAEQQSEILARWFEPGQWRRVEALTRLRLGE
ncbi:lipase secretion chaperone, partial [Aeromonas dhakensis]|uniref:lipase secretion chaperone n=1 Tax=Aeromonas dhakensis TaxID=196024 RepID=UPI0039A1A9E3